MIKIKEVKGRDMFEPGEIEFVYNIDEDTPISINSKSLAIYDDPDGGIEFDEELETGLTAAEITLLEELKGFIERYNRRTNVQITYISFKYEEDEDM